MCFLCSELIMLNFHFFSYYRALWCTHAKIHAWLVTQGCKTITNFLHILLVISYNTHTILCINKVDSKSDLLTNLSGFRFVFSSQTTATYYYFLLMYSTFLNSNLSYIIIIIERVWITKAHIDWLMRSLKMNSKYKYWTIYNASFFFRYFGNLCTFWHQDSSKMIEDFKKSKYVTLINFFR